MRIYHFFRFYRSLGYPLPRALRRAWEMSK